MGYSPDSGQISIDLVQSLREAAAELKHLVCIADVARRLRISAIECHVLFCSLVSFLLLNLDSKC